ncbi:MAG TPA: alpha/beta hydrolase [Nitrososphaeraceae archaeon]|jgi:pimeloyl-ACP methyl ester carboxylesterase|nr:alpha/beta hydrolase [Nitrososphaeraceae archaeon]
MLSHKSISKLCLVIPIALFIVFAFVLIIPGNVILLIGGNIYFGTTSNFAYGQQQPNQINSNITDSIDIQNIPAKKVRVGDIDIAYKMLDKGEPILLVSGASSDMNAWEPSTLRELSSNHTLIIFDSRGVGNTTSGTRPFFIQQLANDTVGLLDALKIQRADVLGYSLGSFVAQQLTVTHPEKVNRLILFAASCVEKRVYL